MAKDPAFLFYPNDWLGGTMGMTFEEKGAYLELLLMQFNRGHMTEHMIRHMVGQIWDKIKVKFLVDEQGLYYNPRLKFEHDRRKTYSESRRNNIKGKNQYSKKEGHMTSHMENENINENVNSNSFRKSENLFAEKERLIPRMNEIWITTFPSYSASQDFDFPALKNISDFIFKQAKIKDGIGNRVHEDTCINTFKLIADQVNKEPFWANKPLQSISKHIQEFYNKIKNPDATGNSSSKKTNGTNYKTAGQEVFADRLKGKLANLNGE